MIKEFSGTNYYLSNFYERPVVYEGITYKSNEAAFQAAKIPPNTVDPKTGLTREDFANMPPNEAKFKGKKVKLRDDWEDIKDHIMYQIVLNKFTRHVDLQNKLISTTNEVLQEGNRWHDTYWGVDIHTKVGLNKLGYILMDVRKQLRKQQKQTHK